MLRNRFPMNRYPARFWLLACRWGGVTMLTAPAHEVGAAVISFPTTDTLPTLGDVPSPTLQMAPAHVTPTSTFSTWTSRATWVSRAGAMATAQSWTSPILDSRKTTLSP